jgi:hypothetical protein
VQVAIVKAQVAMGDEKNNITEPEFILNTAHALVPVWQASSFPLAMV